MFKTLRMRRIEVLVLDEYLDKTMDVLGQKGRVHITRVKEKYMEPVERKRLLEGYSSLLNRIYRLTAALNIEDKETKKIEKISLPMKSSEEYLKEVDETIKKIEEETLPLLEKLREVQDKQKLAASYEAPLKELKKFEIDTTLLGTSKFLYIASGFIDSTNVDYLKSRINKSTSGNSIVLAVPSTVSEGKDLVVVATLRDYQAEVDNILKGLKFDVLPIEAKNIEEIRTQLDKINEEEKKLRAELDKIKETHLEDILVAKEIAEIQKQTQEVVLNCGKTSRVYNLEGWVPERDVEKITEEIEAASNKCCVVHTSPPKPGDEVPISLTNPKIFKPFETILEMFGLPAYTEIDPTPIMAITFPLFFGLMFGDVGHSLIFVLLGLALIAKSREDESKWNYGMLILYCGIAGVIFGFLYGSLFGNEEILTHFYATSGIKDFIENYQISGIRIFKVIGLGNTVSVHGEEVWFLWMSPPNQMMLMIGITLFVGALHMGIGMLVSAVNKIRTSGLLMTIPAVAKIWFFIGEVALITAIFRFPLPGFMQLNEIFTRGDTLIYGILLPSLIIILSEVIHALHHFSLSKLMSVIGTGVFEILEMVSVFLSNTISYSRLLILAVVHAMMMVAVYQIASMEALQSLVIVSPLIIIFGNILVLALEGLVVFIQTVRLHFYEWFSKFYTAGGIKYTPFLIRRKYTETEKNHS